MFSPTLRARCNPEGRRARGGWLGSAALFVVLVAARRPRLLLPVPGTSGLRRSEAPAPCCKVPGLSDSLPSPSTPAAPAREHPAGPCPSPHRAPSFSPPTAAAELGGIPPFRGKAAPGEELSAYSATGRPSLLRLRLLLTGACGPWTARRARQLSGNFRRSLSSRFPPHSSSPWPGHAGGQRTGGTPPRPSAALRMHPGTGWLPQRAVSHFSWPLCGLDVERRGPAFGWASRRELQVGP